MKRRVLILGFLLLFQNISFAWITYGVNRPYNNRNYYTRHSYNYPHNYFRRFNNLKNGTLTGYSPPVYYANPYGNTYYNSGVAGNIKRFITRSFNNDPYLKGNYTNPHSNGFTTLFSNPVPNNSYNSINGFNINDNNGTTTGTTVTIID